MDKIMKIFKRLRFVLRNIDSIQDLNNVHKIWIISGLSGEDMKLTSGWREDREAACNHRAFGGPRAGRFLIFPYPERSDTIIEYVWCAACCARWYPTDTVEYLVRNNQKCPNHTYLGWREACAKFNEEGSINSSGYRVITVKGTYQLEHRFVMEQELGRKLFLGETVHHGPGGQLDNRPENLSLREPGNHPRGWSPFEMRERLLTIPIKMGGIKGIDLSK